MSARKEIHWIADEGMRSAVFNARALAAGSPVSAHFLLQGYPFTGFGRLTPDSIELPARAADQSGPDWSMYWDLRIFGKEGEWHAWRTGKNGWLARFLERSDKSLNRTYQVWGEWSSKDSLPAWDCYFETRGTRVWIPSELSRQSPHMGVVMALIKNTDEASGIVGIVDSMILDLEEYRTT